MLQLDNLVIETTRHCNMQCAHCLRGEPQKLTMDRKYLGSIFSQVDYINSITFTGGEPSLPSGIKVMEETLGICRWKNIEVGNFYVATNGKQYRRAFCDILYSWYQFCSENEISSVDVSNDQFHDDNMNFFYRLEEYFEYECGMEDFIHKRNTIGKIDEGFSLINQGRADGRGMKEIKPEKFKLEEYDYERTRISEGAVYLNCKGNIIRGCDVSYKNQDKPEFIFSKVKDFKIEVKNEMEKYLSKFDYEEDDWQSAYF
jgi:hypothetical protein